MNRVSWRAAAAAALLASAPCRAAAHIEDEVADRWEYGLDLGMLVPLKRGQFSHMLPNSDAAAALFNETVAEEVAEGFVFPPAGGTSLVAGSIKPMGEFGLHGYYHVNDWLSAGVEGGWAVRENLSVDSQGVYGGGGFTDFGMREDAEVYHLAPVVRMGGWIGPLRPYLTLGPELSIFHDQVLIKFLDPDDPHLPAYIAVDEYRYYPGGLAGAGLEWRVMPQGTLQFSCAYHMVYAPGQARRLDYLTPRLSFVVYF